MTNSKITEREIYTAMINGTLDAETAREFAEKKIAQLDKRNATSKARAERKRAENSEITETVYAVLGTEPMTRTQVATAMGTGLSTAKIGAQLTKLVNDGRVQKATVKVPTEDGKSKSAVAYFVAE